MNHSHSLWLSDKQFIIQSFSYTHTLVPLPQLPSLRIITNYAYEYDTVESIFPPRTESRTMYMCHSYACDHDIVEFISPLSLHKYQLSRLPFHFHPKGIYYSDFWYFWRQKTANSFLHSLCTNIGSRHYRFIFIQRACIIRTFGAKWQRSDFSIAQMPFGLPFHFDIVLFIPVFHANWDVRDDHKLFVFSPGTVKSIIQRSQSRLKLTSARSWYKVRTYELVNPTVRISVSKGQATIWMCGAFCANRERTDFFLFLLHRYQPFGLPFHFYPMGMLLFGFLALLAPKGTFHFKSRRYFFSTLGRIVIAPFGPEVSRPAHVV